MILIGDKNIPFETIKKISVIGDIETSDPNSTVIFNFDIGFLKYCKENDINSAVMVSNIKEAIYANSLEARYIIVTKEQSLQLQKIATDYMFDSRILCIIESEAEIEEVALKGIDGVIYKELLNN